MLALESVFFENPVIQPGGRNAEAARDGGFATRSIVGLSASGGFRQIGIGPRCHSKNQYR